MPYVIEGLMDDFEKLIARSALLSYALSPPIR